MSTSNDELKYLPFAAPSIGDEEIRAVEQVMRAGWVTTGPTTVEFEKAFASYIGAPFARAVNSCTAALHMMLAAYGIGLGDEVVLPSLTFAATGNVVDHVGATPVFADVDERTLNVTPDTIEVKLTKRTKAVIVVHYGGLACPMDEIKALCAPRGIRVLEDAAHAVGTHYRGRLIGRDTEGVSFSFYANKNMTTGEGGMLTTSSADLAARFDTLRLHGMSRDAWKRYTAGGSWRYDIIESGFKYNLGDIASAIGLVQLRKLEGFIARRNVLATRMRDGLKDLPGIEFQSIAPEGDRHAYHLFVIRVPDKGDALNREVVMRRLADARMGYSVHFIPLHTMTYYRDHYPQLPGKLEVTERIAPELLSLPFFPGMSDNDADRVVSVVRDAFGTRD